MAYPEKLVRYTHTREKMNVPKTVNFAYADNEIVNARKGLWLYGSEHQVPDSDSRGLAPRQAWFIWKDNQYTDMMNTTVTRWGNASPGEGNLAFNAFLYPGTLMRDFLSDIVPIPKEMAESPEWMLTLPQCLKDHTAEYNVRTELEEVDRYPRHVLERNGKDIIWIDTQHGFNVRRRRVYQPSGAIAFEGKMSGFKERVPGIWLPDRQIAVTFHPADGFLNPTHELALQGKIFWIVYNTLHEARFNYVPDSLFEVPTHLPKEIRVIDSRKQKSRE